MIQENHILVSLLLVTNEYKFVLKGRVTFASLPLCLFLQEEKEVNKTNYSGHAAAPPITTPTDRPTAIWHRRGGRTEERSKGGWCAEEESEVGPLPRIKALSSRATTCTLSTTAPRSDLPALLSLLSSLWRIRKMAKQHFSCGLCLSVRVSTISTLVCFPSLSLPSRVSLPFVRGRQL